MFRQNKILQFLFSKKFLQFSFCSFFIVICSLLFVNCNPLVNNALETKIVKFNTNGGSHVNKQTLYKGEKVKRPDNPFKHRFAFAGWYRDNNSFTDEWDFSLEPDGDLTLYANWLWLGEEEPPIEPDPKGPALINFVSVTVTAPVIGMPQNITAIPGDSSYTAGDVTWIPNDGTFKSETSYTAKVTVYVANNEFIFFGFYNGYNTNACINFQPTTVSDNTTSSITLEYTFQPVWDKTVRDISISEQPELLYKHNDTIDLSRLRVYITFDDSTSEYVNYASLASYRLTIQFSNNMPIDPTLVLNRSTHNNLSIMVSYTLGTARAYTDPLVIERAASPATVYQTMFDVILQASDFYNGTIIVIPVSLFPNNGYQFVEYSVSQSATTPADSWKAENTFGGLSTNTTYYIHARAAQNNDYNAGTSAVSQPIKFFNVNYEANNATSGTPPPRASYLEGTVITIYWTTGLLNETTACTGWNTLADGTGTTYMPGNSYTVSANLTLYAKWN